MPYAQAHKTVRTEMTREGLPNVRAVDAPIALLLEFVHRRRGITDAGR